MRATFGDFEVGFLWRRQAAWVGLDLAPERLIGAELCPHSGSRVVVLGPAWCGLWVEVRREAGRALRRVLRRG